MFGLRRKPDTVPPGEFERCMAIVFKLEGVGVSKKNPAGYVNHPKDPGGETKYGISKKSYPDLDIKALTLEEAMAIYLRDYWMASEADKLDWPLNCVHFDAAVNQGVGMARRFLRSAKAPEAYFLAREARYRYLAKRNPKAAYWLNAWLNRLASLRKRVAA